MLVVVLWPMDCHHSLIEVANNPIACRNRNERANFFLCSALIVIPVGFRGFVTFVSSDKIIPRNAKHLGPFFTLTCASPRLFWANKVWFSRLTPRFRLLNIVGAFSLLLRPSPGPHRPLAVGIARDMSLWPVTLTSHWWSESHRSQWHELQASVSCIDAATK